MRRYVKWQAGGVVQESALWGERDAVFRLAFHLVDTAEWRPEGRSEHDPATHQETHVPRGGVLMSVSGLARDLRRRRETVRSCLARLEIIEFIHKPHPPPSSLIVVTNYDKYNPPSRKLLAMSGNGANKPAGQVAVKQGEGVAPQSPGGWHPNGQPPLSKKCSPPLSKK